MQIANCLVALAGDDGNTVPKYAVTAAEIAVLRLIHGEAAVKDIEPAGEIDRRNREELNRLRSAYGRRDPQRPEVITGPVADLFPGAAARVFESLDELELPEEFFKAERRVRATSQPTAEAEAVGKTEAKRRRGRPQPEADDDGIEDMEPQGIMS